MIEKEAVIKLIKKTGYITEKYVREQYSDENQELLDATLTYLVAKNKIRKITYRSPDGEESLFYLL